MIIRALGVESKAMGQVRVMAPGARWKPSEAMITAPCSAVLMERLAEPDFTVS